MEKLKATEQQVGTTMTVLEIHGLLWYDKHHHYLHWLVQRIDAQHQYGGQQDDSAQISAFALRMGTERSSWKLDQSRNPVVADSIPHFLLSRAQSKSHEWTLSRKEQEQCSEIVHPLLGSGSDNTILWVLASLGLSDEMVILKTFIKSNSSI